MARLEALLSRHTNVPTTNASTTNASTTIAVVESTYGSIDGTLYWRPGMPDLPPVCARKPDPRVVLPAAHTFSAVLGEIGQVHLPLDRFAAAWNGPPRLATRLPLPRDSAAGIPEDALNDLTHAGVFELGHAVLLGNVFLAHNGKKWTVLYDSRIPNHMLCTWSGSGPTRMRPRHVYDLVRDPARFAGVWARMRATGRPLYYQKTDIKNAFHCCVLPASVRVYFGFTYRGRTYRFVRLPFGFSASPSVLQSFVEDAVIEVLDTFTALEISELCVLVILDDLLAVSPHASVAGAFSQRLRAALVRRGFALSLDKCPPLPALSEEWCGKRYANSTVAGVPLITPTTATLARLRAAILALAAAATPPTVAHVSSICGALVWAAAPAHFALPFFSHMYRPLAAAAAAAAPGHPDPATPLELTESAFVLAAEGLGVAARGWADNAPMPLQLHDAQLACMLDAMWAKQHPSTFALHGHFLIYVDFAEAHQLGAIVSISDMGRVTVLQCRPPTHFGQQAGEYWMLLKGASLAYGLPSDTPQVILCGDNEGSISSLHMLSPTPDMPHKAYFARAFVRCMQRKATPGRKPLLHHIAGTLMPADVFTRTALQFVAPTVLGAVQVLPLRW